MSRLSVRAPVRLVAAVVLGLASISVAACGGGSGSGGAETANRAGSGEAAENGTGQNGTGLPEPLKVGLIPNIAPEEQRARYEPFADHLESELGVEVELFVAADYAGVVAALAGDRIDLAYLGGLTYVQAEQLVELEPLVTEVDRFTHTTEYTSAIVVRDDAPYRELADLIDEETVFAFGDVGSTSGSLYPRIMLVDAGVECHPRRVDRCPPLDRVEFTGGHDAAALAVSGGQADAAGLELRILRRLEDEGTIEPGTLRVIAESGVQGYPWVIRTALGPEARDKVREAFLTIEDPKLLDLMRAERYEAVEAADYDEVRERAAELGLLEVK